MWNIRSSPLWSSSGTDVTQNRPSPTPKGDVDSAWSHDLFDQHNSLSARLNVAGLVAGTTTDDVCAIFKRCGEIVKATTTSPPKSQDPVIRVTFKNASAASAAVVGVVSTSLGGRLGGPDGLGLVRVEGSVDVLMDAANEGGSKMRSDSLLHADPRAQVLVAPPGANPADYVQAPSGPRNGNGQRRGGGRGRGGRRGGGGGRRVIVEPDFEYMLLCLWMRESSSA
ncbi:hypothetical protein B0H16DRAFT_1658258 [Mycena metata]|uniref:RRM domain-containing protein n=1 Tax=Mycena metata TaxID=1033252 RepID=A0AAD7KC41_9AGAR|nr:hypothetical protein B0H16DRAFT_1658258 [Mycena metata]